MIIGLSGYAQSGKDTVGAILEEELGFECRAFADAVKRVHLKLFPSQWDATKEEQRPYLQAIGETMRTEVDEDVWLNAALPLYGSYQNRNVVLTDVRYPNEARRIARLGGYLVRVERLGVEPANDHESETALDGWPFDELLYNDDSLRALRHAVLHDLIPALCGKEAHRA